MAGGRGEVDERVSKLVHDFKNSMCNVVGACEMIEMENSPPNALVAEMVEHIKETTQEMKAILESIVAVLRGLDADLTREIDERRRSA